MNEIWVLSVKTSLPNVRHDEEMLKTDFYAFSSFEKAREALRKLLKDFAFSNNSMFDGEGNMTYLKTYLDEIKEYEDENEELSEDDDWLNSLIAGKLLQMFHQIFRGEDCTVKLSPGVCLDAMILLEITEEAISCVGTGEGQFNGYSPLIMTNMLCMQEEKDYYLYLDDMLGANATDASSELYMDLKKIVIQ